MPLRNQSFNDSLRFQLASWSSYMPFSNFTQNISLMISLKRIFICFIFTSSYVMAQSLQNETDKPFILGTIHEIQSSALNEKRTLNIYLPEGYDADDTSKYPVVYLLDGSADEDFIHVVGTYQFNSFDWVKRVPKSII